MRPCGPEPLSRAEIEPGLLRQAARERADEDALAGGVTVAGARAGAALLAEPLPPHPPASRVRALPRRAGEGWGGRLRRRRRLRPAPSLERLGVLVLAEDEGDGRVDLHALRALGHEDAAERALVHRLHLHRRLVGLDLGEHVAGLDLVAFLLVPLGEIALGHGRRQRRHQHLDRHGASPLSDSVKRRLGGGDDVLDLRQRQALEIGGIGQRHVLAR